MRATVWPVVGDDPMESRDVHQRLPEPGELGHLFPSRVSGRNEIDENGGLVGRLVAVGVAGIVRIRPAVVVRRATGRWSTVSAILRKHRGCD